MPKRCFIIRKEVINQTLTSISAPGRKALEPLKTLSLKEGLPFKIIEDAQVSDYGLYEMHKREADLFHCLEGELICIYGGEMIAPEPIKNGDLIDENNFLSREICGAEEVVLKPGDWLLIPSGRPHAHKCTDVARFVVIKIPQP